MEGWAILTSEKDSDWRYVMHTQMRGSRLEALNEAHRIKRILKTSVLLVGHTMFLVTPEDK